MHNLYNFEVKYQIHTIIITVIIYAGFIISSFLWGFNHFMEIEAWK